jgi:DNA-binding beta-propeller fold protein YncE
MATISGVPPCGIEGSGIHIQSSCAPDDLFSPAGTSLDPSGAPVGGPAFNLWVYGSNFAPGSVVRWNGSDRPTTVVDDSDAEAQISASDIVAPGTAAITVFNPASGTSSNPVTFIIAAGGVFPQSVAVDPSGKFAYVANFGFAGTFVGNVSMYAINSDTGSLTPITLPVTAAAQGPSAVAVHPSGKFVYVADSGDQGGGEDVGAVSMYTADATTGALTLIGTIRTELLTPYSLAVDPSGKFAYVPNEGGFAPTTVSMFSIDGTTGALTIVGTVSAEGRGLSVAVDPKGKFAYVVTGAGVSMYTIDGSTGTLTSIGTIAAGTGPGAIAVDPTGKFAYVTNSRSNDVSIYTIDGTSGILTATGGIAAETRPKAVAVDPTGKFAYVANYGSNNISMYGIEAGTGALSSLGTIAAGLSPTSIAIHPNGKFVYVTNSGSNNVSLYSVDPITGVLALLGTVGT